MPVCEGCAASYDDSYKFCPFCGRVKPAPQKINIEIAVTQKPAHDDCPICGNGLNVQKVSAIIAVGTSEANAIPFINRNFNYSGENNAQNTEGSLFRGKSQPDTIQQNKLAQFLAKHQAPVKPTSLEWKPGCWTVGILAIIIFAILGGFSNEDKSGIVAFIPFLFEAPLLLLAIWGITSIINKSNNFKDNDKKAVLNYQSELKDYNAAVFAWNKLYYCHKHDIVFVSGSSEYASKEQMWEACIKWGKAIETSAEIATGQQEPQ